MRADVIGVAQLGECIPTGRDRFRQATVLLLALTFVIASIYRVPFLDQLEAVKIGIFCAELLAGFLLFLCLRQRNLALGLVCIGAIVVGIRVIFGMLAASMAFDQAPSLSLQEARFGLMLAALPLAYIFLQDAPDILLRRFVVGYVISLALIDTWLFTAVAQQNVLVLGLRTDTRFFCSVITPVVATAVLVIRRRRYLNRSVAFTLPVSLLMLAHASLISTSRVETFLAAGLVGFIVCLRWSRTRWWIYTLAIAVLATLAQQTFIDRESFAGRDFALAIDLAWSALPFGYGAVVDATAKSFMGLPDNFFFSDYGMLLYVLRYGVLGLVLILVLLMLWLRFSLSVGKLRGAALLSGPILVYLTFIPLLDYGSLNGSVLLAFMRLASEKRFLS